MKYFLVILFTVFVFSVIQQSRADPVYARGRRIFTGPVSAGKAVRLSNKDKRVTYGSDEGALDSSSAQKLPAPIGDFVDCLSCSGVNVLRF